MNWPAVVACLMVAVPAAPVFAASDGAIAITVTVQEAVGQVAGVELRPPPDQRVRLGETVSYRFRVRNTGDGPDRSLLEASSSRGWTVALPGGAITELLTAGPGGGSRATVEVEVTVPLTETIGAEDTLTLNAASEFNPSVSAAAVVVSRVVERGGGPP